MTLCRAVLMFACLHATLGAQTGASPLHAAWLREILDLDLPAAAKGYREIADDAQAPMLERQIAAARLEELRRLGARGADPGASLELLPAAVRSVAKPLPPTTSNQEPAADPEAGSNTASTTNDPLLRPIVAALMQNLREQMFPSLGERGRPNRERDANAQTTRVVERIRALEIARAELAGKREEADALRLRSFPTWKPQPWPQDSAAAWEQARRNLVAWQQDRQLGASERETLRLLLATLDDDAKAGFDKPLARIARLPLYAERLQEGILQPR